MCSTANYALPLRRTSEVLITPARLCGGVSMSTNFNGGRSYGTSQDTDMDMAWQELMAITELQEYEVPSEGPYETAPYQTTENMVSMGGYCTIQTPSAPSSCDFTPTAVYAGPYPVAPDSTHLGSNVEAIYGQPLLSLKEQMDSSLNSERYRKTNMGLAQGLKRHMPWSAYGQTLQPRSAEDLESDSGLSLGSSPPLASPDNAMSIAATYPQTDMHMPLSDGEMDNMSEHVSVQTHYSIDFQSQGHFDPYSAHSSYFSSQSNPPTTASLKQVNTVNTQPRVTSRGSSQSFYAKHACTTPGPLSRDERRAMALKIPFPIDKIINLPVDNFNELLTQYTLTDSQMALVRDIRRRGKNKVAAQNCRKRKLENIVHLEGELSQLQAQREHLTQERLEFQCSLAFIKCCLADLSTEVFSHLRDENGQPYSIDDYSLQQTPDGKIYLVPRTVMQGREQC